MPGMTQGVCRTGCDVVAQDCGASEQCTYAGAVRGCYPDDGTQAAGQPCNNGQNCAKGTVCIGEQGSAGVVYSCQRFCRTDAECGAGNACNFPAVFPGGTEVATLCHPAATGCNLLSQTCAGSEACFPVTATTGACAAPGASANGASCASSSACQKGSACVGATVSTLSCRQMCNRDGGVPACTAGECSTPAGFVFGVCL